MDQENKTQFDEVKSVVQLDQNDVSKDDFWGNQERPREKKRHGIAITVTVLVLLALLLGGAYYFINASSKYILNKGVKLVSNQLKPKEVSNNSIVGEYTDSGTLKLGVTTEGIDETALDEDSMAAMFLLYLLRDTQINYQSAVKADSSFVSIEAMVGKQKLLTMKTYMVGKKRYILMEELLNQYLELEDLEEAFDGTNYAPTELEDYHYLMDFVLNRFVKRMDEKYISKENRTISFHGKDTKVVATTFKMNEKEIGAYLNLILDDVKKDQKANSIVINFYPEFKDYSIPEEGDEKTEYAYTVYTTGFRNEAIGVCFTVNGMVDGKEEQVKLEYLNAKDPSLTLWYQENKLSFVLQKGKDSDTIVISDQSKKLGEIKLIEQEDKEVVQFELMYENVLMKGELQATVDDFKASLTKTTLTGHVTIEEENVKMTITMDLENRESTGAVINADVTGAIKADALTEEQNQQIVLNLYGILMSLFQGEAIGPM